MLILFIVLCITPISLGAGIDTNQTESLLGTIKPVTFDVAEQAVVEPNLFLKQMPDIDLQAVQNLNHKNLINTQNNNSNQSVVRTTGYNPLNAPQIQFDQLYGGYLTAQGQQHLYYLQVPTNGKITEMLEVPAGLDYDIALYRINPPGQGYTGIASSNYAPGLQSHFGREQVSAIVNAGDYYVLVEAVSGFSTTNPYYLWVVQSTSYSSYEPNDNLFTPSYINVPVQPNVNIQDNIDNAYDNDFFCLSVAEADKYRLDFLHTNGNGTNKLGLYQLSGSSLTYIGEINENTGALLDISSGTYYIRVFPYTYSSSNSYQIKLRKCASNVQINQVMGYISAPPYFYSGSRTDTFGGSKFVVDGRSATGTPGDQYSANDVQVRGVATDSQNRPIANANIKVTFNSSNNYYPQVYGYGYTNSNGEFFINMSIPSCFWTQRLPAGGYVFRYSDANFIVRADENSNYGEEWVIHMFSTNLDYEP